MKVVYRPLLGVECGGARFHLGLYRYRGYRKWRDLRVWRPSPLPAGIYVALRIGDRYYRKVVMW